MVVLISKEIEMKFYSRRISLLLASGFAIALLAMPMVSQAQVASPYSPMSKSRASGLTAVSATNSVVAGKPGSVRYYNPRQRTLPTTSATPAAPMTLEPKAQAAAVQAVAAQAENARAANYRPQGPVQLVAPNGWQSYAVGNQTTLNPAANQVAANQVAMQQAAYQQQVAAYQQQLAFQQQQQVAAYQQQLALQHQQAQLQQQTQIQATTNQAAINQSLLQRMALGQAGRTPIIQTPRTIALTQASRLSPYANNYASQIGATANTRPIVLTNFQVQQPATPLGTSELAPSLSTPLQTYVQPGTSLQGLPPTVVQGAPQTFVQPTTTVAALQTVGDPCGCGPITTGVPIAATQPTLPVQYANPNYGLASATGAGGYTGNRGFGPILALRPAPTTAYVGQGSLGQPKAYVPGQSIRNFFRYWLP